MDVATLILDFIARIAWPLLALVALLTFSRPLKAWLPEATEVSAFGVTLKRAARAAKEFKELAMDAAETVTPPHPLPIELGAVLLAAQDTIDTVKEGGVGQQIVMVASDAVTQAVRAIGAYLLDEVPDWDATTGPAAILNSVDAPAKLVKAAGESWRLRMEMVLTNLPFSEQAAHDYADGALATLRGLCEWAETRS